MIMKQTCLNQRKRAAFVWRGPIIHNGLKKFFVDLAKSEDYNNIVVMIDSSCKGGNLKNCINATDKEKMLRAVMKAEGIPTPKVIIVPMPNAINYREWVSDIYDVCKSYKVTHFCIAARDKEEFIDALEMQHKKCNFTFIAPTTDFPYTTNELCSMISRGDYEQFMKLIPEEVVPILEKYSYKQILESNKDKEWDPIDRQQFVSVVFVVKNVEDGKKYVLLEERTNIKRKSSKLLALPGGAIRLFESATSATVKYFQTFTGLKIKVKDNSTEPAIIKIQNVESDVEKMYYLGCCTTSAKDFHINEMHGFLIYAEEKLSTYQNSIRQVKGLQFYDVDTLTLTKLEGRQNEVLNKALEQVKSIEN